MSIRIKDLHKFLIRFGESTVAPPFCLWTSARHARSGLIAVPLAASGWLPSAAVTSEKSGYRSQGSGALSLDTGK
jgi:hypothetical protein